MPYKVVVTPPVFEDIEKAKDWFDSKSIGLGDLFIDKLFAKLDALAYNALHYQIRYNDMRLLHLHDFGYSIHYRVSDKFNAVFIEAIFGMKQNPEKWRTKP